MALITRRFILVAFGLLAATGLAISQQNPPAKQPPKQPAQPADADAETVAIDLKILKDVGLANDGPALLEYFRKQTLPMADPKKIESLIRQLGDDDFETREDAFAKLAGFGAAAAAGLKQFEQDKDTELRKRVHDLKKRIELKADPSVQSAAARTIARGKPAGAAEVLLAFLPFAVDPNVVDDVAKTLGTVGVVDGKPDPAVVSALTDKIAVKRGAAAEALVRGKADAQLPAVRGLLKDQDPYVRLRVALALVPRRDKEIVPVLINLLAELRSDAVWPAEEVLVRLAGDKQPVVALGNDDASRKAARDAWQKWYEANQDKLDLARLENPDALLGYTVIVHQVFNNVVGKFKGGVGYEVAEVRNSDKNVRWKFSLNTLISDVQVVGENRVLIAEYQQGRISERDFKGNEIWSKAVGGNPLSLQRLPNGNIFVVKLNGLVEYDRQRNEVYSFVYQLGQLARGKKLRNGEVAYIANNGNAIFTRMDAKNKVLQTFNVGPIGNIFGNMDVLPNGGVVVPDWKSKRVIEYDKDGREVKSFNTGQWPISAIRLPNGNTLVTTQQPGRVIEFNHTGQEVWSYQPEATQQVFNARRR
jgi:hypothetical protein